MRKALVLIPLVAVLVGFGPQAQAATVRGDNIAKPSASPAWMFGNCNLLPAQARGQNSVITAVAHISCGIKPHRLYLHVCVFYSPNGNDFSNAYDIGCSPGYYKKPGNTWFTWTCWCDYIGPHNHSEFEEGRGYYWTWAEGWCQDCTPQYRAGPGKSCYYDGIRCD